MLPCFISSSDAQPVPVRAVAAADLDAVLDRLPPAVGAQARASRYRAGAGEILVVAGDGAGPAAAFVGMGTADDPFAFGAGPLGLPPGDYELLDPPAGAALDQMVLAWALGAYQFTKYKEAEREPARLVPPDGCDLADIERQARAVRLARDMINTPAAHMGPKEFDEACDDLTEAYGAVARVTVGDMLLKHGYPMVHAVGRAASVPRAPRVLEFEWGEEDAPRVAVVGKGVCFDSGGLNLKPGDSMRLMKKDMGGAANAMALAWMIMDADLPVRLHVLAPLVENAIGPEAFRPGDVLASRAELSVEIENTDAEGRLILADALTRAAEAEPDLIIDFATLTGAARVALGAEIAPYYTNDDELARALDAAAGEARDPMWRMPLWPGYERELDSPIADLRHLGSGRLAGSITAALFLQRFTAGRPWVHLDIYAWNDAARPGRPAGGEAQGPRALYRMLKDRYPR